MAIIPTSEFYGYLFYPITSCLNLRPEGLAWFVREMLTGTSFQGWGIQMRYLREFVVNETRPTEEWGGTPMNLASVF